MKKKKVSEERVAYKVIRKANERDLEKLETARSLEKDALVKARAISRTLNLDMKLGEVEFQADMKKATFYYTANGRVDFRELVKIYARDFKVKIEMRQIGSRQESSRIGGIGSCGRELCCSTWLSDFSSVNTGAARYQNLSINQSKLSGQCGRLKCCLNYELDTYMDAIRHFPDKADVLMTQKGKARLMKTDIFKGLMYYAYDDITMRGIFHPLYKDRVKEILGLNSKGIIPEDLSSYTEIPVSSEAKELGFADVTGEIELPNNKKRRKKNNKGNRDIRPQNNNQGAQKSDENRAPKPKAIIAKGQGQGQEQAAPAQEGKPNPTPNKPKIVRTPAVSNKVPSTPKPEVVANATPNPPAEGKEQGQPNKNFKKKKYFKNKGNKNPNQDKS